MAKFRKKPLVVEADQFLPPNNIPIGVFNVYEINGKYSGEVWTIHRQKANVVEGDWIIKEPEEGFYYPCKPDIFEQTYERLNLLTGFGK